jgi:glucose-1-phosphate thymidylyltransferase
VGPFSSISANCLITSSELEHSIILEGVTIEGVGRIEDSLIGREVEVRRSPRQPLAHRLMLGDNSRVELP